jgi:hypothetical protein
MFKRFSVYCFAYPARFELQTSPTEQPQMFGPALDQNADALRASLVMQVKSLRRAAVIILST